MKRNTQIKIRPVILSGGSGKRLWPVSHHHYPKQFAKLLSEESLFVSTLKRVNNRKCYAAPIIVGNIAHATFIFVELAMLGITDATVILEPCGRNTANAAMLAALNEKEKNILHLVMPSDHYIADEPAFHNAVRQSMLAAIDGYILSFGIQPTYPETGYGYIVPGERICNTAVCKIGVFSEKPTATSAKALISQGALWNSGMFLYKPDTLRKETRLTADRQYKQCSKALKKALYEKNCIFVQLEEYGRIESHSFDTLIMEKTQHGAVLPCSMGWNDIGSWYALWQIAKKDKHGNALSGAVVTKDVSNSYIRCEGISVAAVGLKDCLIVSKDNHVLVAGRSRAQEVKDLLAIMEEKDPHSSGTVTRPWGSYIKIAEGKHFLVKQITLRPGCAISLQAHKHRAEHWIVISGVAKAECDGDIKIILPNESAFVPLGAIHRLSNHGDVDLHIVEVQSGAHLSEDDIIRFDDMYGRTCTNEYNYTAIRALSAAPSVPSSR